MLRDTIRQIGFEGSNASIGGEDNIDVSIYKNPFSIIKNRYVLPEGLSIHEMLSKISNEKANHIVFVNDRLIEKTEYVIEIPKKNDVVTFRSIPAGSNDEEGGKDSIRLIASLVIIVASAAVGNAYGAGYGLALSLAGNLALNALVPPPVAKTTDLGGFQGTSAGYAIAGSQNQLLPFGVVPRVLGEVRMWPPYGAKPYTETNGNDVFVRMLFCLGPGPLDKSQLKIGETLISEFDNVDVEYLTGNQTSTLYPTSIYEDPLSILLSGETFAWIEGLPGHYFWGYSPTPAFSVQTTQLGVTKFSIDFYSPILKYYKSSQHSHGPYDLNVAFVIEVKDHDTGSYGTIIASEFSNMTDPTLAPTAESSGMEAPPPNNGTIYVALKGNDGKAARGSINITMSTSGQWDVGIRKHSLFTTPYRLVLDPDFIYDDTYWTAIRSEAPVGSAISPVNVHDETIEFIAMRIKATDQLNGVVDSFNLICGAHHPVYDGLSWTVQATKSPAWVYSGVLTDSANKRALPYSRLDSNGLLTWSQNCAVNGFEFGAVIVNKTPVLELLKQICSIGKASFGIVDGQYGVVEDKPLSIPSQLLTPRNSWNSSGQKTFNEIPHALRCKFIDGNSGDAPAERVVYDDGYNAGSASFYEEMDFVGVRDGDHAWKLGRYFLAAMRLRPETFERTVDLEHLVCTRGDLVWLRDDTMLVGLGEARIKTIDINGSDVTITFDDEFLMEAGKDYGIKIRTTTETISVQVNTVPGYTSTLSFGLAPASSALLNKDDLFAFGEFGSEVLNTVVKKITPGEDLTAVIQLVAEAPGVHTAHEGQIPDYDPGITIPPDISQIKPAVPVIDIVISDESAIMYANDGTSILCIIVSFNVPTLGSAVPPVAVECQYRTSLAPYLYGDQWTDSPPDTVSWNQHNVYCEGDVYIISADSTTDQYIYWFLGDTSYTTSNVDPSTTPGAVLIAQNLSGLHSLETITQTVSPWTKAQEIDFEGSSFKVVGVTGDLVYQLRIRSVSQYGVHSAWAYTYHVVSGMKTLPPIVTGVQTISGSSTEFVGKDLDIVWAVEVRSGVPPKFEITVNHGGADLRTEIVSETSFKYTYSMNVEDGSGTPSNSVTIKIRSFNAAGYSDTVTTVFTNPAPSMPSSLDSSQWMNGVEFAWGLGSENDLDHYLCRVQVESEGWQSWVSKSKNDRIKYVFLDDTQTDAYPNGATIYFEVKAVDTFGSESSVASTSDVSGAMYVPFTALTDFKQISGAFYEVPVLRDFTWQNNTPSAGYVSWSTGTVYYNGTPYSIDAGSSQAHWIYWNPNGTTTIFVSTDDDSTIPEGSIIIAVNNSGTYSLAWANAVANQVIGSAWIKNAAIETLHIKDLAVTNEKVNDLDGQKIHAGTILVGQINSGDQSTADSLLNENQEWNEVGGTGRPVDYAGITDANIIVDPNFQITYDGNAYWETDSWSWATGTMGQVGNYGENSTPGVLLTPTQGAGDIYSGITCAQKIPVKSGEKFYLRIRYWLSTDFETSDDCITIQLEGYDKGDNVVQTLGFQTDGSPGSGWLTSLGEITFTDVNVQYCKLLFYVFHKGSNDFSSDSNCIALWNLESGALTTDSKNSNTLTDINTVGSNASDYKQGSSCADFEYNNNERLEISDANLHINFPFKFYGAYETMSVCCWIKPESIYDNYIWSKWDTTGNRTIALRFDYATGGLELIIGDTYEVSSTTAVLTAGRWYHVAVTYDNGTKSYRIRIWDDFNSQQFTDVTGTFTNIASLSSAPFVIGGRGNGGPAYAFDGLIDEVVVFNDILSVSEIDEVRLGTYGGSTVADGTAQVDNVYCSRTEYAATNGAIWDTNLSSIPAHFADTAPDNSISIDGTNIGFHATGSNWPIRIQNDSGVGKFYCGNGGTRYIEWDGSNLNMRLTKLYVDATDGIELTGSGNMKVGAGNDINLIGSDTDPGKINFIGTSYEVAIGGDIDGNRFFIEPSVSDVATMYIGGAYYYGNYFYDVSMTAKHMINLLVDNTASSRQAYLRVINDGSTISRVEMYSRWDSTLDILRFVANSSGGLYFGPFYHKATDLAQSGAAFDDAYADDFNNVADVPFLDDIQIGKEILTIDDLEVLKNIMPSQSRDKRTGIRIINDSTLPNWLVTKYKNDGEERIPFLNDSEEYDEWEPKGHWHWAQPGDRIRTWKRGDTETDKNGKPYISTKTHLGLHDGAIRALVNEQQQVHEMLEFLNIKIKSIEGAYN